MKTAEASDKLLEDQGRHADGKEKIVARKPVGAGNGQRPVALRPQRYAAPQPPKAAATELVAEAFPFNAAKPTEFEKAASTPQMGQNVEPPDPSVGGSTLSEKNTSAKVGERPTPGSNPAKTRSTACVWIRRVAR